MLRTFLLVSLLTSQAPVEPPKPKVVEYDLLPVCVEQIVVNKGRWHCIVDDPKEPKGIYCDEGSMTIILKKNFNLDTCTQVHMVVERDGKP
jgi:hypothetical protein